jgi:hypothetical protein
MLSSYTSAAFGRFATAAMAAGTVVVAGCAKDPPRDTSPPSSPPGKADGWCDPTSCDRFIQGPSTATVIKVAGLFRRECASCHGGEAAPGGFDIFDHDDLIRRGLLGPWDKSPRFSAVAADLPAHVAASGGAWAGGRLAPAFVEAEVAALRAWIAGGAPDLRGRRTPVPLDEYEEEVSIDALFSRNSPGIGTFAYLDLRALYNNNQYGDGEFELLFDAALARLRGCAVPPSTAGKGDEGDGVTFVQPRGTRPIAPGEWPIAVRFDLRRFGLTADDLARLVALTGRREVEPARCEAPAIPLLDFLFFAPQALPACAAEAPAPAGAYDPNELAFAGAYDAEAAYGQPLTPAGVASEFGFVSPAAMAEAAERAPRAGPSLAPSFARGLSREALRSSYEELLTLVPSRERDVLRACVPSFLCKLGVVPTARARAYELKGSSRSALAKALGRLEGLKGRRK